MGGSTVDGSRANVIEIEYPSGEAGEGRHAVLGFETDASGAIKVGDDMQTSRLGLYAAAT